MTLPRCTIFINCWCNMNNNNNNRYLNRNIPAQNGRVQNGANNAGRSSASNAPYLNGVGANVPNSNTRSVNGAQRPPQSIGGQNNNGAYRQIPVSQQARQKQYPPVRHVSRKEARKRTIILGISAVVTVLLLLSVIIFTARCAMNIAGGIVVSTETADTVEITEVTEPAIIPETEPAETEPPLDSNYEYIEISADDVHTGYQILINYDNPYVFREYFNLKTLYSAKNGLYKVTNVSDSIDSRALDSFVSMMSAFGDATGNRDIIVTSADRTYEFQEQLYDERVEMYGEEYARLYVAEPGHSEHHTGLALDLAIYTDGGKGYTFDDKPEYGDWMRANSYKFGFIERYQASKTPITKIAYENWHYRFVGKPHAYYIKTNDLCLEEYIDLLRTHDFKNKLTFTDDEGSVWDIYFVPADGFEAVKIPVPKYFGYEISGNNVDGFIVTVSYKSE